MEPFDFTHAWWHGDGRRKGGERRNGRNTRVWHKKNLDTGMRKAERERERERERTNAGLRNGASLVHLPPSAAADGQGKSLQSDTYRELRVVVIRSVRLPRSYLFGLSRTKTSQLQVAVGARWR